MSPKIIGILTPRIKTSLPVTAVAKFLMHTSLSLLELAIGYYVGLKNEPLDIVSKDITIEIFKMRKQRRFIGILQDF